MTMQSPLLPAADMLPHWLGAVMCQKATLNGRRKGKGRHR
jgi:hypothetical protein